MKIFLYELKKVLIKQYAIIILAAVVIVRLLSSLPLAKQTYGFDTAKEREAYFELINPFVGEVTEEKITRAYELEQQLKSAQDKYDELREKRWNKESSDADYYEQIKECEQTLSVKKQIEKRIISSEKKVAICN